MINDQSYYRGYLHMWKLFKDKLLHCYSFFLAYMSVKVLNIIFSCGSNVPHIVKNEY